MILTRNTYRLLARARARGISDREEDFGIEGELDEDIPAPLADPSIWAPGSSGNEQYGRDSA